MFEFLRTYDAPKATATKLRQAQASDLLLSGEIGWKKKLWFQLTKKGAAAAAIDVMSADPGKQAPRFLVATDGVEFYARDIKSGALNNFGFHAAARFISLRNCWFVITKTPSFLTLPLTTTTAVAAVYWQQIFSKN
jgi:hypothetical protein